MSTIEQKFAKLGNDILEQLYVTEVIEALDQCFGLAESRAKTELRAKLLQDVGRQHEDIDVALVSHDYSDRYELSLSNE